MAITRYQASEPLWFCRQCPIGSSALRVAAPSGRIRSLLSLSLRVTSPCRASPISSSRACQCVTRAGVRCLLVEYRHRPRVQQSICFNAPYHRRFRLNAASPEQPDPFSPYTDRVRLVAIAEFRASVVDSVLPHSARSEPRFEPSTALQGARGLAPPFLGGRRDMSILLVTR